MKFPHRKLLIALFCGLWFCHATAHAVEDPYKEQIDQLLNTFESLVKEGIVEHLNSRPFPGQVGGAKFEEANEIVKKAWDLAVTAKLDEVDPKEFLKVAQRYLLFKVRAANEYDESLKEISEAYSANLPNDAILNYLYGLALFRKAESEAKPEFYDKALLYINKAIGLNPNFPEAYWVHSQILAIKGGNVPGVRQDFAQVRRCEDQFSPLLYLYDEKTMATIQKAARSM